MAGVREVVGALRRDIPDPLADSGLPGLAVGVCDASDLSWAEGFGTTRAAGAQPVGISTALSGRSASKMYTAAAVMLAVQQGLVELDVPITSYLPEFSSAVDSRRTPRAG